MSTAADKTLPDAATLIHLVKQEAQNVQQLKAMLEQEKASLIEKRYKDLQQQLQQKRQLLAVLEKNAQQRQNILKQCGMPNSPAGWRSLMSRVDQTKGILSRWEALEVDLRQCHSMNAVNEKLTHRTHMAASHMLDILRGAHNQPKLYTDTGARKNFEGAQRSLGTA